MTTPTLTLYGISNCDTMKKTRQWLEAHGLAYEFHDYKKAGLERRLAELFLQALPMEELINKRGTTWRKLPLATQASLSAQNAAELISANPSLVRRPLLHHHSKGWSVGYDESRLQSLLA